MQELKRLAEGATPGPWSTRSAWRVIDSVFGEGIAHSNNLDDDVAAANARFIAAANPAVVLSLIARIEELEGK